MATKLVFDAATGETKTEPLTAEEIAQAETDANAAAAKRTTDDAETLRVATYADDPEVTDGLTAIKGGTAQEVDAYVESVITLTATDINTLREEVQAALRAILRRQLKVQFDPAALLEQLNGAKEQAAKVKERNK
jgi:hypothetical protein